jgi:hypothetical protein
MGEYRSLTQEEIGQLEKQVCRCGDWGAVKVGEGFSAARIWSTHFEGSILIGANVEIDRCSIANYAIEDDVVIKNVGTLAVRDKSSFGNGVCVNAVNEAGGREVPIFDTMGAQVAAIMAFFQHRQTTIQKLKTMICAHAAAVRSSIGTIGKGARIINCGCMENVRIGPGAVIDGASHLSNGTVGSSGEHPTHIGPGVIARDFIIASGAIVTDRAVLSHCFVGQAAEISGGFSAEHSLFFANCQAYNGEGLSIFAGPFTVSHHKSSLLIAAMFSFFNAGSNTNQSNHLYKLGPVHQGIMERGCKTGSGAYMLWPARIGAFTTVIGKHSIHVDTASMPFSLLLEEQGSVLVPGSAIKNIGTLRDIRKWPKRDKRKDPHKLDFISFESLSPYTAQNIISGRNQLSNLKTAMGTKPKDVVWNGLTIKSAAIGKGIEYYDLAMDYFVGAKVVERLRSQPIEDITHLRDALMSGMSIGSGRWMDLAGLLCPEEAVSHLLGDVDSGKITSLEEVHKAFKAMHENYPAYEWCWVAAELENRLSTNISKITPEDIAGVLGDYRIAVEKLNSLMLDDARKEYDESVKIGYGFDSDPNIREADFEAVRGKIEDNEFIHNMRAEAIRRVAEADGIVMKLKKL